VALDDSVVILSGAAACFLLNRMPAFDLVDEGSSQAEDGDHVQAHYARRGGPWVLKIEMEKLSLDHETDRTSKERLERLRHELGGAQGEAEGR